RKDAHIRGSYGVGDVLGQRGDLLHLGARGQLDLVAGHRWAAGESGDLGIDLELLQGVGQRIYHYLVGFGSFLGRRAGRKEVLFWQGVGDVPGELQLFAAGRNWRLRGGGEPGGTRGDLVHGGGRGRRLGRQTDGGEDRGDF